MANDTTVGAGSYYRNQIEKLLQVGIMSKDDQGNFNPNINMTVSEFISDLSKVMNLDPSVFAAYTDGNLTREIMGAF